MKRETQAGDGWPDRFRAYLRVLADMQMNAGMSYNEMAEATELPLGTVKSRLNRARLELATSVRRRVQIRAVPPEGTMAEGSA